MCVLRVWLGMLHIIVFSHLLCPEYVLVVHVLVVHVRCMSTMAMSYVMVCCGVLTGLVLWAA